MCTALDALNFGTGRRERSRPEMCSEVGYGVLRPADSSIPGRNRQCQYLRGRKWRQRVRLLFAERLQRIDASGAAGGDIASEHRNRRQEQRRAEKQAWVASADLERIGENTG